MSLTMNMVGGGGGIPGNWAIIVARVPSGSVVTATKDGITLTPKMWVTEADPAQDIALFALTPAQFDADTPWTITATDGTNTASTTIYITTNKEYEVELSYLVPSDYQAVQYLEGAQNRNVVFDTGITPAASDFVSVRFSILSTTSTPALFGSTGYYATFTNVITLYKGSTNKSYPYNLSQVYEVQFVNGDTVRWSTDGGETFEDSAFVSSETGSYSFALCSMKNGANSYLTTNLAASKRIYRATIQDAEFVPCYRKSDSVPGFWNRRDEVFITNVQDGVVIVGPDL